MKTLGRPLTLTNGRASGGRDAAAFEQVCSLLARLFAPEDGCPWARQASHSSQKRYLLEEALEVMQVLDEMGEVPASARVTPGPISPEVSTRLAEELGDVFWNVLIQMYLAHREGLFSLADVLEALAAKMIRRNPHIFGQARAETADEVDLLWAAAKRAEQEERTCSHG